MKHYNDFPLDGTIDQDIVCFHHRDNFHNNPLHRHRDHVEIYLFLGGDVLYLTKKMSFKPHPGDLVITPANVWHQANTVTDKVYDREFINIRLSKIRELSTPKTDLMKAFTLPKPALDVKVVKLNKSETNQFSNLLQQLITRLGTPDRYGNDVLLNCLQAEILLFTNHLVLANDTEEVSYQPNRLQQILDYIDNNLGADLRINTVAQHFYLSAGYLNHYFHREVGLSMHSYIKQMRIDKARKLLIQGESITNISEECGFGNYSSFFRAFKKAVGVSPGQFQKSQSNKKNHDHPYMPYGSFRE